MIKSHLRPVKTLQWKMFFTNRINFPIGQPSTGKKKKTNTLTDSNYFYTEESISCTNFRVLIMPFACTLRASS